MMPITIAAHGCTNAHGAVMATRPASMPFTIIPGSGFLAPVYMSQNIAATAPNAAAIAVFVATVAKRTSVDREGRRGVEAEPAEQQDEATEHRHRDVVTRQRAGLAVGPVLADAGTEHERTGQRRGTTDRVHHAGAGEVDVAEAEVGGVAELGEPAAAPGPGAEQRVVDGAAEEAPPDERLPLPPLGHRAGRDGGDRVHERHHVEEERHATGGVEGLAGTGPAALPQEHPVTRAEEVRADRAVEADQRHRVPAEHQAVARPGSRRRTRGRRWRSSSTPRARRAWPGRSRSRRARTRPA